MALSNVFWHKLGSSVPSHGFLRVPFLAQTRALLSLLGHVGSAFSRDVAERLAALNETERTPSKAFAAP